MSDIKKEDLEKEIKKLIKNGMAVKKIRPQLEKIFGEDLKSCSDIVDKIISDVKDMSSDESEDEEEDVAVKSEEESDSEEEEEEKKPPPKAASRKRRGSSDSDYGKKKPKKAPAKKAGGRGKGSGYTRAYKLSPALADLMGAEEMPRHEVVKRVWSLIKERKLYDPNNKQFAICDDGLYKVIGTKRFKIFGMMKYLKNHFLDD